MGDDDLTAKEAVDLGRRVSERRRTTHVRLPDPVDRNIDRVEKVVWVKQRIPLSRKCTVLEGSNTDGADRRHVGIRGFYVDGNKA